MLLSYRCVVSKSLKMFFVSGFEMFLPLRNFHHIVRNLSIFVSHVRKIPLLVERISPIVARPIKLRHNKNIV